MTLSVSSAFDGGNIHLVAIHDDRIDLEIVVAAPEPQAAHFGDAQPPPITAVLAMSSMASLSVINPPLVLGI